MTANIHDEQKATMSYAIAAKKAQLHAVIQAPAMLFSALQAVVHGLHASNLVQQHAPIIVVPASRITDCGPYLVRPVVWGGNPCGMVSDTIVLYVGRGAQVDAYEYIKCDILPRLTIGGSLIVLADTTDYADQVSDAVADLLPDDAIRVRMGCAGKSAESLLKLMSSMGPAAFNQHYGIRSDLRLATQPTAADQPCSEPASNTDLHARLAKDHLVAALGFEPTLQYIRDNYGPHWNPCSANKNVGCYSEARHG